MDLRDDPVDLMNGPSKVRLAALGTICRLDYGPDGTGRPVSRSRALSIGATSRRRNHRVRTDHSDRGLLLHSLAPCRAIFPKQSPHP
jgi:hypothetical protein